MSSRFFSYILNIGLMLFVFATIIHCTINNSRSYFDQLASTDAVSSNVERMYIALNEDYYSQNGIQPILYELSIDDEIVDPNDCSIGKDDESAEDKYCILDVNEMDLLSVEGNNILPLHYQVPREMCEHTAFMMPFHWNYRTGIGPLFLIKYEKPDTDTNDGGGNNNNNDDGQEEEKEECYLDLCAVGRSSKYAGCTSSGITKLNAICNGLQPSSEWSYPEDNCDNLTVNGKKLLDPSNVLNRDQCTLPWRAVTEDSTLSQQFCNRPNRYDHSLNGGKNCCIGTYYTLSTEGEIASSTWGGKIRDCVGGPIQGNDGYITYRPISMVGDSQEFPSPKITYTWDKGANVEVELNKAGLFFPKDPTKMTIHNQFASIGTATYYDGIKDLQWTKDSACSNCPSIYKSDASLPAGAFMLGYPYFTLECKDSNFEVLHRLHLIIREWNVLDEFGAFQDGGGDSGDPDIEGPEGSDCNYYESDEFGDDDCNDLKDLDDFIEGRIVTPFYPYPGADYSGSGVGG